MIRSFEDERLERLFDGQPVTGLAGEAEAAVLRKLLVLNAACHLGDLMLPRRDALHRTGANCASVHLLHIQGPLHLRFRWANGDAWSVALSESH